MTQQNNVIGALDGCIEEINRQFPKKGTDTAIFEGIQQMISNFRYYAKIKADSAFILEVVKYHDNKERELIEAQKFDKTLRLKRRGGLIAIGRIGRSLA